MVSHIQLQKAQCVICLYFVAVSERAVAVLGDLTNGKHRGSTLPFEFPPHGHNFRNTTVYINKREETWRLCRYPPCSGCSNSLKAFIFHVDCFRLAKGRLSKLSLPSIWLLGLLPSPSAGLYHLRRPRWDIAHLATYADPAADLSGIIKGLKRLPVELCEMVARECPESPLWRYSVVNAFSSHYIYCSQSSIKDVHRGEYIAAESNKTSLFHLMFRAMFDELAPNVPEKEPQRSCRVIASS